MIKVFLVEDEVVIRENLTTSPVACLELKSGSLLSRKILFVAICRTIGIGARVNTLDMSIEYYKDGKFITVNEPKENKVLLQVKTTDLGENWIYMQNWSIAILIDGQYKSLNLDAKGWNKESLLLNLDKGEYRIITSNRLPNGNIFANKYYFSLEETMKREVVISLRQAKLSQMLINIDILDFDLRDEEGAKIKASKITRNKKNILIWLDAGKEPTEHILNEISDRIEAFNRLDGNLILVLKDKSAIDDPTIARTLDKLSKAEVYYDSFDENTNTLGRRMYVDPEKLPLIIVTSKGLNGVYATSGYNVGTADMLLRILSE